VIHTVGPVYQGGGALESYYLACCYRNCLLLALAHGLRTLAFPAISCGVYGYPAREAARIAVGNIAGFIADEPRIESVDLVCFNASTYYAYEDAWNALLGRG
jgi:O-acetyl-ADP-ribose deacetylase (regulator of RNase III)